MEDQYEENPTGDPELVTRAYVYMYGQQRVKIETKDPVYELFGEMWPDVLAEC